jgi:N-acetylglutamate synthase-like GNAT family acetyltransferase
VGREEDDVDGAAEVTIREVQPQDRPAVIGLIEPYVVQRKLLRRTFDEVDDLLRHGFVAECAGEIVGFAALEIYSRKLAEIRSLAVADGFQRRGIGRQLVAACIALARERRILEVMAISSSEVFFRSCGFDYTLPDEKKAFFFQTRQEP